MLLISWNDKVTDMCATKSEGLKKHVEYNMANENIHGLDTCLEIKSHCEKSLKDDWAKCPTACERNGVHMLVTFTPSAKYPELKRAAEDCETDSYIQKRNTIFAADQ